MSGYFVLRTTCQWIVRRCSYRWPRKSPQPKDQPGFCVTTCKQKLLRNIITPRHQLVTQCSGSLQILARDCTRTLHSCTRTRRIEGKKKGKKRNTKFCWPASPVSLLPIVRLANDSSTVDGRRDACGGFVTEPLQVAVNFICKTNACEQHGFRSGIRSKCEQHHLGKVLQVSAHALTKTCAQDGRTNAVTTDGKMSQRCL